MRSGGNHHLLKRRQERRAGQVDRALRQSCMKSRCLSGKRDNNRSKEPSSHSLSIAKPKGCRGVNRLHGLLPLSSQHERMPKDQISIWKVAGGPESNPSVTGSSSGRIRSGAAYSGEKEKSSCGEVFVEEVMWKLLSKFTSFHLVNPVSKEANDTMFSGLKSQ
jgi:hypothetical protein